jgi:hypothetical protein
VVVRKGGGQRYITFVKDLRPRGILAINDTVVKIIVNFTSMVIFHIMRAISCTKFERIEVKKQPIGTGGFFHSTRRLFSFVQVQVLHCICVTSERNVSTCIPKQNLLF